MSKTMFQTVAEEFAAAFTQITRHESDEGGRDVRIWTLKDDASEWMRDAMREAHSDGRMPDDWIYENCASMVQRIAESECADECDTCEIADSHVDVYTAALTTWLASSLRNVEACDEAISEGLAGDDADLVRRMSVGQYILLDRACAALIHAIDEQATERDDASEDDEDSDDESPDDDTEASL